MPTQFIIKLLKTKDKKKPLKTAKEKQYLINKGNTIEITAHFSSEAKEVV